MYARTRTALAAALVAAAVALTGPASTAAPGAPRTEPISVTPGGKAGDSASEHVVISRDGRHLAFSSTATDLVPGKPGGVFVRDLRTGRLERVAAGAAPAISADGRYVAVGSTFRLHDRRTGRTERLDTGLPDGFTPSGELSLSADARYAVLVASADEGRVVFLRDRARGTTERISHPRPTWEPRDAFAPTVSDDGERVVYQYTYANGPRGDDWCDIWMLDRATGERTRIDRSHDGSPTERESLEPSISGDGRTVVFESRDTRLVPNDRDGSWNVFVHTVATGENRRLHAAYGGPHNAHTRNPAVSADGRHVTFTSWVEEPGGGSRHPVHLRDLKRGTTVLLTPDPTGGTATASVEPGAIADGAGRVAFVSGDPALIPGGDTNDAPDVFVRHTR
ncbi:hypothetical protein PV379_38855 [Streptomyces caniscabiei]|uniref:hypothetical protein n=1 Tax=Streptomyces caniscabiei TaxID=2746961 RepID=UPI0029BC8EE6|nr:hypothetical protein [Streptomyces caniscabiei]MDX2606650.1 hypothetical protein [Streptomyces caniscabiei]MDX2739852.1 hypothetical protein [Streptomyces caniscabiei]MDX2783225.1 hypothetical protein [Streptomyces caniscabiei]